MTKRIINWTKRKVIWIMFLMICMTIFIGFIVPKQMSGRASVIRVQCQGRLITLNQLMLLYADSHNGWYPISGQENAKAHDSFQLLVESMHKAKDPKLSPDLFVCPGSGNVPAECVSNGYFRLTEANVSYAIRSEPLQVGRSSRTILMSDKSLENHNGKGINVLRAGSSIVWVSKEELDEQGGLEVFLSKHGLVQ